ncbi:MAG: hypothetical protein HY934_06005 [Candidatus Firestonebacteria bacterium]|nr:hypothetical protein [Candidatus Firestonebacteria bacterium]
MKKELLDKLGIIGILFEFIGIILVLFFQIFMQEIYTRKVTITGKHIILMMVPENRIVLWIGFILLVLGFIFNILKELNLNK